MVSPPAMLYQGCASVRGNACVPYKGNRWGRDGRREGMICIHQRACVRCHFLQLNLAALDFGNDVGEKVLSWGFALETACCSHCQQSFGPQELQERKREGERSNEPLHLLATVSLMGRLCPHCKRRQQPLAQRPENTEPPQVIHQDDLTHMPEDQFDPEVVFLFARPTPRSAIRPHPISALLREEEGGGGGGS